jgi:glyoxylase-like metal-dependent hydrolase (beta-lactamase superfamily II)
MSRHSTGAGDMIFRQLCTSRGGHLSYLLGDPVTREAIVIDPMPAHVDTFEAFIAERGLNLRYILQTHHESAHIIAAIVLQEHSSAQIVAHESVTDEHIDLRLRHGDILYFGEEKLRVLHTPGQSPCAVTYWWEDRLFTGKTLLATGTAPCTDQSELHTLYHSITNRLLSFPGETLIYPGLESKGRRLTSIEELRRKDHWLNNQRGKRAFLRSCALLLPEKVPSEVASKNDANEAGTQEDEVQHYMPSRNLLT